MHAPKPDRSGTRPNLAKTAETPVLDLGWNEGFLSDTRPYRVEAWAEDQVRSITVFMSTNGIENYTNAQFADLLEREELIAYHPGRRRSAYAIGRVSHHRVQARELLRAVRRPRQLRHARRGVVQLIHRAGSLAD